MVKISDKDREKIIKVLAEGKDLPTLYQAKLFNSDEVDYVEATKDYKLVYKGKTPEARVIAETPAAPLQEIREFNTDNAFNNDWANMLIFGDNLYALKAIYEDQRKGNKLGTKNKIKLIYIDPPFATKQDFMKDREKAYRDKVIGAEFIEFLRKRLILMREILADNGTIYVHLDWKKSHYIKTIMDEIFGEHNFLNNVVWCYKTRTFAKTYWNRKHDDILVYAKNSESHIFKWNDKRVMESYSASTIKKFKLKDDIGWYRLCGRGIAGSPIKSAKDVDPKWEISNPELVVRSYLGDGFAPNDYWQIEIVNQAAIERTEYPTQKPERLLEKIVSASSNEGDIVLDAFFGSGSTLAVSEKLGRRWIGMDCGKLSVYTTQKRLLNLTEHAGTLQNDDERDYQRVEDFEVHNKTSRGLLMIYEKARAGDFVIDDGFLASLGGFVGAYLAGKGEENFSLICPEEKFHVKKLKVRDNEGAGENAGQKMVKVGRVKFLISFITPKEKTEESKPLKAKHFKLYSAGMYDNEAILKMDWEQYKPFVAQLFDVRLSPHKIKAFEADGYIGTSSTSIWNYPDNKKLELDEGYVDDLHKVLGGKGGDKFYVIAPIVAMRFMQDEIKRGNTTYVFLKVPLSILIALIQKKQPGALKQPMTEADVNEVIDAVGFDFISQPVVKAKYKQTKKEYVIDISEFRSNTLAYDPEEFKNFETLSMVMVDVDYNEKSQVFDLDKVYWSDKVINTERTKAEIRISAEEFIGKTMMIIYMDRYGNEYKVVKKKDNFK